MGRKTGNYCMLLLWLVIKLLLVDGQILFPPTETFVNGTLGKPEFHSIDANHEITFTYWAYKDGENFIVDTNVGNRTTTDLPVTFEIRQRQHSQSWQLPFKSVNTILYNVNTTICSDDRFPKPEFVMVSVSTLSKDPVNFTLVVRNVSLHIAVDESRKIDVTPTSTQLLRFSFPSESEQFTDPYSIVLSLSSNDTKCMTVSVQDATCPFLDKENNINYRGLWFTMTKRGAFTLQGNAFENRLPFFLVLVLHWDDADCSSQLITDNGPRMKTVEITVSKRPMVLGNILLYGSLPAIAQIVLAFISIGYALSLRDINENQRSCWKLFFGFLETPIWTFLRLTQLTKIGRCIGYGMRKMKPIDYKKLTPITREECRQLIEKTDIFWIAGIIGIYYFLPAIKMVFMYLYTLQYTRNLDICYYNFECAYPVAFINDFNHLYSNYGYVVFGVLAFIVVMVHQSVTQVETCGIPSTFGISYSLAICMIFQGLLSASYHLCPTQSNFHHDTTFMYISVALSAVKMYQLRHPRKNVGALTLFYLLSLVMMFDYLGEYLQCWWFFVVFTVFYVLALITLGKKLFCLGVMSVKDMAIVMCTNYSTLDASRDVYYLIVVAGIANIGIYTWNAITFFTTTVKFSFGSFILFILIVNMAVYIGYYLLMKIIHGEKIVGFCVFNLLLAVGFWISGMYFFDLRMSAWEETPAESRIYNRPCKYFDSHDIWHLLSSFALFTTMMLMEFIDVDIRRTRQEEIPVF